jgi:hypothetical protein
MLASKGKVGVIYHMAQVLLTDIMRTTCACGGTIIRSRTTGILHRRCFSCRYLHMVYGNNVTIRRIK